MKKPTVRLTALVLLGALLAGCYGPCQATGRLGTRDLPGRALVAPTVDVPPVWFDIWAEGTMVRRSTGEVRIPYEGLWWRFSDGWFYMERRADTEMQYDIRGFDPGTYTAWLEAWYGGDFHQVSDEIQVTR